MKNWVIVLIIAILVAAGIAYFVVSGRSGQTSTMQMQNIAPGTENIVYCPVTGEKIKPSTAYSKMEYKGKTYYFCCAGCPEEFMKNPEKYIKK